MTRSFRVLLAVMATMTLAACNIDPVGPAAPNANPSLDLTGTAITLSGTALTAVSTCSTEPVVSGSSTYIVAYTEPQCAQTPTEPVTAVPAPKPDSLSLRLSFP